MSAPVKLLLVAGSARQGALRVAHDADAERLEARHRAGIPASLRILAGSERAAQPQVPARGQQRHDGAAHATGGSEHRHVQHDRLTPRGS